MALNAFNDEGIGDPVVGSDSIMGLFNMGCFLELLGAGLVSSVLGSLSG